MDEEKGNDQKASEIEWRRNMGVKPPAMSSTETFLHGIGA
jgi:hypothetical protein